MLSLNRSNNSTFKRVRKLYRLVVELKQNPCIISHGKVRDEPIQLVRAIGTYGYRRINHRRRCKSSRKMALMARVERQEMKQTYSSNTKEEIHINITVT